ncbi:UNVERIFIED_CONTAM: hypothetical protein HHA_248800 [Hammondia hammondi]|eukprot:XP_008883895.1 hypothetical protein HHA_248800 [Hammondia hammondi]
MRQTARGERRRRLPSEGAVHAPESASASRASSRVSPDKPTARDRACTSAGAEDGRDRGSGPARGDEKQKEQKEGPQRETRNPGSGAKGDDEAVSSRPAEDADASATGEKRAMSEDLRGDSERLREDGRQREETSVVEREAAKEGETDGTSDVTQKMRELLLLMTTRGPANSGGGKVRVFREILDLCKCLSVKDPPHPEGAAFLNRAFGFLTISKHWDASDEEKREICSAVEEHLFLFSKRQREQLQQTLSLFCRPLAPAHAPPLGSAASEAATEAGALGDAQQTGRREATGVEINYASSSAGAPSASASRSPFSSVSCSACPPTTSVCSSLESSRGPSTLPFPAHLQCVTAHLSDPSSSFSSSSSSLHPSSPFSSSSFFPASSSLPSSSACVFKGDAAHPLQQTVNVNLFYSLADLPEQSVLHRLLCESDQETATKLLERLPKPAIHFNCFFVYPEKGVVSGNPHCDATSETRVTTSSPHAEERQRSGKRSCYSVASSSSTASSTSFSASSSSTAAAVAPSSFSASSSSSAFSSSTFASCPSISSHPFASSSSSPHSASASASSSVSAASLCAVGDRSGVLAETEDAGGDTASTGVSRQVFVASYSRREEPRESRESGGHRRSHVYGQRRGISRGSRKRSLSSSMSSPSTADRPCSQLRRRGQKASWGGNRSSPCVASSWPLRGSRHLQREELSCRSLSRHPRRDTPAVFAANVPQCQTGKQQTRVNPATVPASVTPSSFVSSDFRVSSPPHVSACASPHFPVSSSSSLTISSSSSFPPSCFESPSDERRVSQDVVGEERPAPGTSSFRGSGVSVHDVAACVRWPEHGACISYASSPHTLVTPPNWLHSSFSANASHTDSSRPGRAGGERGTDPSLIDPYMSGGKAEDGRRDCQPGPVDWNSVSCLPRVGSARDACPRRQEGSAGRDLSVEDQGTATEASREERGSVAPRW